MTSNVHGHTARDKGGPQGCRCKRSSARGPTDTHRRQAQPTHWPSEWSFSQRWRASEANERVPGTWHVRRRLSSVCVRVGRVGGRAGGCLRGKLLSRTASPCIASHCTCASLPSNLGLAADKHTGSAVASKMSCERNRQRGRRASRRAGEQASTCSAPPVQRDRHCTDAKRTDIMLGSLGAKFQPFWRKHVENFPLPARCLRSSFSLERNIPAKRAAEERGQGAGYSSRSMSNPSGSPISRVLVASRS